MNVLKIIMTALLFASYSSISKADTVIISYSDGKNQTVTLDSPVKSITSVQYIPSSIDNITVPQTETAVSPQMNEAKQPLPQKDSAKPKIRFKWADPIVGQ